MGDALLQVFKNQYICGTVRVLSHTGLPHGVHNSFTETICVNRFGYLEEKDSTVEQRRAFAEFRRHSFISDVRKHLSELSANFLDKSARQSAWLNDMWQTIKSGNPVGCFQGRGGKRGIIGKSWIKVIPCQSAILFKVTRAEFYTNTRTLWLLFAEVWFECTEAEDMARTARDILDIRLKYDAVLESEDESTAPVEFVVHLDSILLPMNDEPLQDTTDEGDE